LRFLTVGLLILGSFARAQQPALLATDFPGANAGTKIAACIAALPSAGGVCDARGLTGEQSISSLTIAKPVRLLMGAAKYSVTGTVTWQNVDGPSLVGVGTVLPSNNMTVFIWAGDATAPMFRLSGVRNADFRMFTARTSSAKPLVTAILSDSGSGGILTTGNHFTDINIDGTNGGISKGFRFIIGINGDVNNDVDVFTRVRVSNYSTAGWSFEHSQSKGHEMYSCSCSGNGGGQYCITTALGVGGQGGSFRWIGGGGGGNTVADFYLGSPNDPINIIDSGWLGSDRFLLTAGNSSSSWPVTLIGNEWETTALNPDGNVVYYTHAGVLAIYQNNFVGNVPSLRFFLDCHVAECRGLAQGNTLSSTVPKPFVGIGNWNWSTQGNWRWNGTNLTPVPDVIQPWMVGGADNNLGGPKARWSNLYLNRLLDITGASQGMILRSDGTYSGPAITSEPGQLLLVNPNGNLTVVGSNGVDFPAQLTIRQSGGNNILSTENASGTTQYLAILNGGYVKITSLTFANLKAAVNGVLVYCSDCTKGSNPCSGVGTGTFAFRIDGSWICF